MLKMSGQAIALQDIFQHEAIFGAGEHCQTIALV